MKRNADLFWKIVDIDNLILASYRAFKGKSSVKEVKLFRQNFLENIFGLKEDLMLGNVEFGNYHRFVIYEPKERLICAAPIKQRIIHHAIMNICHNLFDRHLIFDCYASRPGKGIHKAIVRVKEKQKLFTYFVKLDIKKFFDSINHDVLKKQLKQLFKDEQLLSLFDKIIDSYGDTKGMPIGNLTSQYFANHYLSSLDHYMKEIIKVPFYIRYMDDVVMMDRDKENLKQVIRHYILYAEKELKISVKPPLIGRTCHGVPFLGYKIFGDRIIMNGKGKRRFAKKLLTLKKLYQSATISEGEYSARITSLLTYACFADSYKFRSKCVNI